MKNFAIIAALLTAASFVNAAEIDRGRVNFSAASAAGLVLTELPSNLADFELAVVGVNRFTLNVNGDLVDIDFDNIAATVGDGWANEIDGFGGAAAIGGFDGFAVFED